ncbi:nitroreductase family protein, partial [bacterium]|nr:nitroreductase family protein [bacterium]
MNPQTAQTDAQILDLLKERWSPRAFADKLIESDKVQSLFEAARWSPSCFNDQPWQFVLSQKDDSEGYDRILRCLLEKNQSWAKTAPLIGIAVARNSFRHNQKPNRHAWYDLGQAMAHLTFQAAAMGLYVHQMAGFSETAARSELAIPDGFDPVSAFTIGYLGSPEALPENQRQG